MYLNPYFAIGKIKIFNITNMLLSALYLYGISRELRLSWLHVILLPGAD